MKKTILILSGIFLFLIISAIALPYLFKDKIAAKIDQELANSVNATIYYDIDQISLSIFKRFPNISATIEDFGIIGKEPFLGDTLAQIEALRIDLNLRSVLFDEFPTLTGIHLDGGDLLIKVLEDGRANYDISFPTVSEEPATESNFRVGIDYLEVSNLNLLYDDRSLDFFVALGGIKAKGTGEFTLDIYQLPIQVEALIADLSYEKVNYLQNKTFKGETDMTIDMNQMKFSFGEGDFALNDFLFGVDGFIALPEEDIEFDLSFLGKENSFKSILSLVPGIYTESFSSLETSGTMDFKGFLKGIYNKTSFPTFDVSLQVADGMFKYPSLPEPVKNVNLELQVSNSTNNLDNTSVSVPTFNLDFGSNPISGRFYLKDLISYTIDGTLKGKLDLEELTSIFPIEGLALKGMLDVNATAKGTYDSVKNIIPTIDANLNLANGYVKSSDYPAPIENLNVTAIMQNTTGNINDFLVNLSKFGFDLEGQGIQGNLKISDFEALNWDGRIKGGLDLAKILAIFPMENMEIKGLIAADIETTGSYENIENKRFDRLNTQGTMSLNGFSYTSPDIPNPILISNAEADFTKQQINLTAFDSKLGSSALQAKGYLSNYMNYILQKDGILKGELALSSANFNVNEWMTESTVTDSSSSALSVFELPQNIDFTMAVAADQVRYDNLNLKKVNGKMILREGVLTFSDASMNALDGRITLNGNYDPRILTAPKFALNLDLSELSIPSAFQSFNTIQAFAPIAQHLTGVFSTKINFSGILGQDMMPVLSSLDGNGLVKIVQTALTDSKIIAGITSLTKLKDTNNLTLKNISIPIEINDGLMQVKPFDLKLWDYEAKLQGSAGFDGSINYLLNLMVPASKFGSQANALLTNLLGNQSNQETIIPIALNLTGTYNSPKISLAGGNSIESMLSSALQSRTGISAGSIQDQVAEEFKAQQDSMKQELKLKASVVQDSVKKELEKQVNVGKDQAIKEAKKLLKGFLTPKQPVKPDTIKVNNN
jgi:hypothetical protein